LAEETNTSFNNVPSRKKTDHSLVKSSKWIIKLKIKQQPGFIPNESSKRKSAKVKNDGTKRKQKTTIKPEKINITELEEPTH